MPTSVIRARLATAERETIEAGGKTIEVVRFGITEAGQRAIESRAPSSSPAPMRSPDQFTMGCR